MKSTHANQDIKNLTEGGFVKTGPLMIEHWLSDLGNSQFPH